MELGIKSAIVKAVAAVAWADGSVSPEERLALTNTVANLGGLGGMEINKILENSKDIDPILPTLKNLDLETAGKLLTFCYNMSVADNKIHKNELEVIKKIARLFWSEDKLDMVLDWLHKSYKAEQLYMKLFLLEAYKKGELQIPAWTTVLAP